MMGVCAVAALTGSAVTALVAGAAFAPAFAQTPPAPTLADYARAEQFMPYSVERLVFGTVQDLAWSPGGKYSYRTRTATGFQLVQGDAQREDRSPAPDRDAAAKTTDADLALSPDKKLAAFLRDDNLWVRDVATGAERQLTTDGIKDFGYATHNEGFRHGNKPIVLWSPDSKRLATYQQDQRGVGEMSMMRTMQGHPQLETWKYSMSGDEVIPKLHRVIVDVAAGRVVRLQIPPDFRRSVTRVGIEGPDLELADAQWSSDSSSLAFVSVARDFKRAQLRIADAATGAVREIFEERMPTFIHSYGWRFLSASNEVVWHSQRDDWGHLYLYDAATGKLKRQLTTGRWNVSAILHVNPGKRTLYFLGVGREPGRDPYFHHLYRIGLDGKGLKLLTPEAATHEVSVAPDGDYFIDSYSRPQTPPVTVLRNADGKQIRVLERADISRLAATGWHPPEPIVVKARDGQTDLYGLLFKPSTFDPNRRYPLINSIYPGPLGSSVQGRDFATGRGNEGDAQSLAELGFIVVQIDGMGTALRSKSFHDTYYGNMRDNTLPDQVAGMKQLAQRYPWIDIERAGIFGLSGGGFATARALLDYPDFFKVGVAVNGNHDERSYTDNWGELFMGLLEKRPDGTTSYDSQANQNAAHALKGKLLLVYGTMDDNVSPNQTLVLIDALIEQNKDFDVMVLPNQAHLAVGTAGRYLARRRWDYFVRNLMGVEPPREYRMQGPPAN